MDRYEAKRSIDTVKKKKTIIVIYEKKSRVFNGHALLSTNVFLRSLRGDNHETK